MPDASCINTGQTLLVNLREPAHLLIAVNVSPREIPKGLRHTSVLEIDSRSGEWAPPLENLLGRGSKVYFVRPDGYIGFAGKSAEAVRKYADMVGLL